MGDSLTNNDADGIISIECVLKGGADTQNGIGMIRREYGNI